MRRESISSFWAPGQLFFCRRNNLVFAHSQQLGEGTATQELDNREAPQNPLCPANVHHRQTLHRPTVSKGGFISSTHRPGRKSKSSRRKAVTSYLQTSIEPCTLRQVLWGRVSRSYWFSPPSPLESATLPNADVFLASRERSRNAATAEFSLFKTKSLKGKIVLSHFQRQAKIRYLLDTCDQTQDVTY